MRRAAILALVVSACGQPQQQQHLTPKQVADAKPLLAAAKAQCQDDAARIKVTGKSPQWVYDRCMDNMLTTIENVITK